eukprot:30966-Pelagococcus_subviridis.AAC.2
MSSAAMDASSVANVFVPPPRNKNPSAMDIATCAPWERPAAPPAPVVAAAAAVAAVAAAPATPATSSLKRSRRSNRSAARSPVPAMTSDSAIAATPTHVSSVGRSTSFPGNPPAAAVDFILRVVPYEATSGWS